MLNWVKSLEKLRVARHCSQAALAVELGVTRAFLNEVIRDKKELSEKLKLAVWSQMTVHGIGVALDRDSLLSFLPSKVATELLRLEGESKERIADSEYLGVQAKDWVDDLVVLISEKGMRMADFAREVGVSQPYLSCIVNRKKDMSWGMKVSIWNMRNYDLSSNSILNLLSKDLSVELRKFALSDQVNAKRVRPPTVKPKKAEEKIIPPPIRLAQPSAKEIHDARVRAGLSQCQAARLITPQQVNPSRIWQAYELPKGRKGGRCIPLATWELFLLLTHQHPHFALVSHNDKVRSPKDQVPVLEVNANQLGLSL